MDNTKNEFLADMSHEMRTPLNAIIGFTGLIMANKTLDEETYQHLKIVREAGITLLGFVNDLLNISGKSSDYNEDSMNMIKLEYLNMPYAHVLVVDDNQTNLDVAKGLMKPYGMKIACVDSGQKAIDAVKTLDGHFCAIFMDQMMPGMDGIETARRIRALKSDHAENIPIIALTANAITGNEKIFINNGFQAFLTKPINIFRLDSVIKQWIYDKEKEEKYNSENPVPIPVENKKSNDFNLKDKKVDGLNIIKGINRFGGNEGSYIEILRAYTDNTKKILASAETVDKSEKKDYEIVIHGLKGSNYSISADKLGDMAKKLELAVKEDDWDFITEYNPVFIDESKKFISNLEEMLITVEPDHTKKAKDKPDETVLKKLRTACDKYDMDAVDEAMEAIAEYRYNSDEGLTDWLQENVEQMNFSDIAEKINTLR